jgi:tRNA nucleotidyltransferase (CCA-adding enzyme)
MPDYNFLMDSRLKPSQSRVVNQLGRLAARQGLNLYLAGGAVRDLTLGIETPRNLDFVVEGNIQKILRPIASQAERGSQRGGGEDVFDLRVEGLRIDSRRNLASATLDGVKAEIATSRNEVYRAPSQTPAISSGSIFDDLRRRDFSVNAMAISLHPNSRGLLLDPTNGAADIERKELRALHSRSFFDDPSRIYRLLRLGLRLGFKPDERTERWLGMALEERVWESLDEHQQGRELAAILEEEQCRRLLKMLRERGLLAGLDHSLASTRIDFDEFERVHAAVRSPAEDGLALLNFHALVAKLPPGQRSRLARKIFPDAKTTKFVLGMEREVARLARQLGSAKAAQPSQVYTLLAGAPRPLVLYLSLHYPQTKVQSRVKSFLTKFAAIRARLPRAELQSLGVEPGPKFEKVLERVFLDELDGKIRTPQQMTKALRDYAGIKPPPPPPPKPKVAAKGPAKPELLKTKPAAKAKAETVKPPKAKPHEPPKHGLAKPKAKPPHRPESKIAKPAEPKRTARPKVKPKAAAKPAKRR